MDRQLSASLPAKDASVCPLVVGRRKNPKMAWESLQVPVCSAEEAEAPPTAAKPVAVWTPSLFWSRKQEVKTENCRLSGLTRDAPKTDIFFSLCMMLV